jgi:hypothetical protein
LKQNTNLIKRNKKTNSKWQVLKKHLNTKDVITSRKWKDRQHIDQKEKDENK